jgi:hypothetical protein
LTQEELTTARRAEANEPQTAAALRFAAKTVRESGGVSGSDMEELRNADPSPTRKSSR